MLKKNNNNRFRLKAIKSRGYLIHGVTVYNEGANTKNKSVKIYTYSMQPWTRTVMVVFYIRYCTVVYLTVK